MAVFYSCGMKLFLHPGGALFLMSGLAFFIRQFLPIDRLPLVGGVAMTLLFFAMIFGLVGGVFLTLKVRQAEATA